MGIQGNQGTRLWHRNRDFAFRGVVGIDGPEMGDKELTRLAPVLSFSRLGSPRSDAFFLFYFKDFVKLMLTCFNC